MHPTVSVLILVAITIVFSLIVYSYFIGLWSFEQEKFTVTPMLYARGQANGTGPKLSLHLRNDGGKTATIIEIEIRTDIGSWYNYTQITVPPHSSIDINITDWKWSGSSNPPSLVPGQKIRVIVYTENFGPIFFDVVVEK